jgi:mono/diheme cytochrome c family protein
VTTDGFFIFVDARDRKFDAPALQRLVESLGALNVEACFTPAAGWAFPKPAIWIALVAVLLGVLPVLLIARSRLVKSPTPRLDIFSDMDFQPKYKTQAASGFFADGRTMRPPVPGAVRWGAWETDERLDRGKVDGQFIKAFPMPPSRAMMDRGQQRFNIYCTPCHGWTGEGDGMTAQRATQRRDATWVPPVSLTSKLVREEQVGEIFQTISNGIRKMPSYAAQITPQDRWAIILYIRALQRSQNATIHDVPEDKRWQLR